MKSKNEGLSSYKKMFKNLTVNPSEIGTPGGEKKTRELLLWRRNLKGGRRYLADQALSETVKTVKGKTPEI